MTSNKWPTVKFGDIASFRNGINYGKESFGKGVKVINVRDFKNLTTPNYNGLDEINPEGVVSDKSILEDGDIVLVRSNGNRELIGRSLYIQSLTERVTHSAFSIRARISDESCLPRFYSYVLRGQIIRKVLTAKGNGTNISNLNQDILSTLDVPKPPFDIQEKISNSLENYDNLIENNNRRIAILEDMAQSLYSKWFVHFMYPGHQDNLDPDGNAELVDSPLGQVPSGWEIKSAQTAITINPKTKLDKTTDNPFVSMSGLAENSMVIDDVTQKKGNSGAKFVNGDTLFARITPCLQNGKTGYVQFLTEEQPVGFGSTEFIVLRESQDLSSEFIYLLSRSNNFREHAIQSMTGATGRQRVHNDCFASFYIAVPPRELMDEFTTLVSPMFKSIFNLSKRNENLKKQRDMLLPKLISREIEL
ncbi:restriction endonuclease subunit S [Vibrio rotiferianus]|uniref:restriction endonuclease subunit S n=1 Tax=Vibrio rotiferianus TaxID=190895 RepID=UPI00406A33CD